MSLRSIERHLIRGRKVTRSLKAVLGILFLAGLYVSLVRAQPRQGNPEALKIPASPTPPTVEVEASLSSAPHETRHSFPESDDWGDVIASDPLVRVAEMAAVQGDPFRIDHNPNWSPVLFETDDVAAGSVQLSVPNPIRARAGTAHGLVLRSTIVGVKQRAALINARLCFEGSEINVNGERYFLRSIYPRKVVLFRGAEVIELAIPSESDPAASIHEPSKLQVDGIRDD